jgi:hypothetical protein
MHNLVFSGVFNLTQKPSFPPAVKSMRGTRLEPRCVRADSNEGLHEEER